MSAPTTTTPVLLEHNLDAAAKLIEHASRGEYCTALGPYASGKTSLLRYVHLRLAEHSTLRCIYMSLDETDTATPAAFFTSLARRIARLTAMDTAGEMTSPPPAKIDSSGDFRAFIAATIAWLGRDLVLIIDDLESVPTDLLRALLSALRTIYMEQYRAAADNMHRLGVIVAGALSLAGLTIGESSPFHGIALAIQLGDLSDEDSRKLIVDLFDAADLSVSRRIRENLLHKTRGNANLSRLICRRCLEAARLSADGKLTLRKVRQVINHFIEHEAAEYPPLQEAIRLIEEDPDLLHGILLLLKDSSVPRRALPLPLAPDLDPLLLTGIVHKCADDTYQLHNDIYRRVLERRFIPSHVSHLLTTAGRWDEALDHLEESVCAGDKSSHAALLDVTLTAIYAAEDYARAGGLIARAITTVFGAQQAAVWLLDENRRALRCIFPGETTHNGAPQREIALAADQLETQALREPYPIRTQQEGYIRRAAPLFVQEGRPLGVVTMIDATDMIGSPNRRAEDSRLQHYLRQAARGLHELIGRQARNEMLREISKIFSGLLSINRVLELTLTQLARAIPFDSASIQLLNRGKTALEIKHCQGFLDPTSVRALNFPLQNDYPNVRVWNAKAPQRYANVHAEFKHLIEPKYQMKPVQGWMGIPLIVADEAIGVITLDSYVIGCYTLEYENMAMLIAGMAAVAIQRALLYERQQQEKVLLSAAVEMIGSVQDLKQTWRRILEGAMDLTEAEAGSISQVDETRGLMIYQAQKGFPVHLPATRLIGVGGAGRAVAQRTSLLIDDVQNEPDWRRSHFRSRDDTRSELVAPIFHSGSQSVGGVISLESPRTGAFTPTDRRLLEDLAIIADLALSNAQHYQGLEKQRQQIDALYASARMIAQAGLDAETVLQTILDRAIEVTKAKAGTIQMTENQELLLKAAWPIERKAALIERIGRTPLNGASIAAQAVRANRTYLISDAHLDGNASDGVSKSGCELAVLLRQEGQAIGVLHVEHPRPYALDEADRELLEGLAELAVIALQNVERYKELERTKDELLASQAVAWLGLFGADWQHTINQKILSIQTYADALRELIARHASALEKEDRIQQAITKITEVATSIRSVPFNNPVPPNISTLINIQTCIDAELPKIVSRWCTDRRDVEQRWQPGCPGLLVNIHPQWLRVALEKLINNALKAMPAGGMLTIATEVRQHMVAVTIRDSGRGIPEHARSYFLKKNVPRKDSASGSGMGALIARFIAVSHGGDLQLVATSAEYGTELLLTLPIAESVDSTLNTPVLPQPQEVMP